MDELIFTQIVKKSVWKIGKINLNTRLSASDLADNQMKRINL